MHTYAENTYSQLKPAMDWYTKKRWYSTIAVLVMRVKAVFLAFACFAAAAASSEGPVGLAGWRSATLISRRNRKARCFRLTNSLFGERKGNV